MFKKQWGIATASITLIIALSVGLGGTTLYFYTQSQNWERRYQGLNEKFESLEQEKESIEENYQELETDYRQLELDYSSLQIDYNAANSKLNDFKNWEDHLNYYRIYYDTSYQWGYATYSYLNYWKNKERDYPSQYNPIDIDLNQYIMPNNEWSRINSVSEAIADYVSNNKEYAEEALDYVHATVYYMSDEEATGEREYWKYPTETVFDQLGDCEDTVFLYASLLRAQNIPTVIIEFPEHVAVGVGIDDFSGTYYEHGGKKYFFAETTSNKFDEDKRRSRDYRIGEKPTDLPDEAYIHKIE